MSSSTVSSNPLRDLLPPKVRQVLYGFVFLALLAWGAWNASNGDVGSAVFGFLTSLAPLLAAGNLPEKDESQPPVDYPIE